jgi:N-succinyldiaminopimelate aminotransferase
VNPRLGLLQPYPFERLAALLAAPADSSASDWRRTSIGGRGCDRRIDLSIGEPRHPAPQRVRDAIAAALDGLSSYPATRGSQPLREAIAGWIERRYGVRLDPATAVLPILGSREALFAIAQVAVDPGGGRCVVAPNPFYQIYEGAALLAGASVHLVNQWPARDFRCDWAAVPDAVWDRCDLLFVCSPGNPTGSVMALDDWQIVFERAERHGFVIASDECYSEIYLDEATPPLGGLEAARLLGRGSERLLAFSSLSKRSNLPGMRSGFVAGDPTLIARFLQYRTYHGSAMSLVWQAASIAAWNDEAHVRENRALYRAKYAAVMPVLGAAEGLGPTPPAGFYVWLPVPNGADEAFTRRLHDQYNCLVVPGSYLARVTDEGNPGRGRVRLALVDSLEACAEGAGRIADLLVHS